MKLEVKCKFNFNFITSLESVQGLEYCIEICLYSLKRFLLLEVSEYLLFFQARHGVLSWLCVWHNRRWDGFYIVWHRPPVQLLRDLFSASQRGTKSVNKYTTILRIWMESTHIRCFSIAVDVTLLSRFFQCTNLT